MSKDSCEISSKVVMWAESHQPGPNFVPLIGFEPIRLAALDFESSVSAVPPQGH